MEAVARGALGKGGLIAGLAVAACATPPASDASAPRAVEEAAVSRPVGDRGPPSTSDQCKAGEMQYLVGRSKAEIPVPVDVVNRRVTCTTCPVTEEFAPFRLNIFFNAETDIVEQVRCG